ncbi:hypothetical protein ZIOFF_053251 [Zingiber officinale]|uniref:Auxin-responsive protein n=1 Tax=Zingiber officinale TaxID=94328 RepID=A0A8J5KIC7_ZINOF|nr:hypothetical protein ZIOFF_053251 [Zingiber officinale]
MVEIVIVHICHKHEAVLECCVLGLPDEDYGEVVSAVIVPHTDAKRSTEQELEPIITLEDLRNWAKEKLAPYKLPTKLFLWDSLPRNAMGKFHFMTPPTEHDYMGVNDTELRLGLPGSNGRVVVHGGATAGLTLGGAKRGFSDVIHGASFSEAGEDAGGATKAAPPPPPAKTQIVIGWPPIRSYRKNTIASNSSKNNDDADANGVSECHYVKVGMDGAPYLRKVNLNMYSDYKELSLALEKMFTCFTFGRCGSYGVLSAREMTTEGRVLDLLQGSEHTLTYEDKDGDWMLVGDVPWPRLRIMKGSDAIGIRKAPKAMEKSRIRN